MKTRSVGLVGLVGLVGFVGLMGFMGLVLGASSSWAQPARIRIDRATIAWPDLKKLLEAESAPLPREMVPQQSPMDFALGFVRVNGELRGASAKLRIEVTINVLEDRWVTVPLISNQFSVAAASIVAPIHRRAFVVRDGEWFGIVAEGSGAYAVSLELERTLEGATRRLSLSVPGASVGRARLWVAEATALEVGGSSWWTVKESPDGVAIEAALQGDGFDLRLGRASSESPEASALVEELMASTVVSLGGTGVTRLSFFARAGQGDKSLSLVLPAGARLWRVYLGTKSLSVDPKDGAFTVPLEPSGRRVELSYTFDAPRLGIRGRYHLELPSFPITIRGARWNVWMPDGLAYDGTQSSLPTAPACGVEEANSRIRLETSGRCLGFSGPVLEPGRAYAEGVYSQKLGRR
ncbi:MAG: hypothetical protein HY791_29580 [Deltaproteobacteria bacterium]|nr:hypothetical protein [Deltaproteobacteria bacterium]